MSRYVQLQAGHFALMMGGPSCGFRVYDHSADVRAIAETLVSAEVDEGIYLEPQPHNIEIYEVCRVMPNTFSGRHGLQLVGGSVVIAKRVRKRVYRSNVIASAKSLAEALSMKSRLLEIGAQTDEAVRQELSACVELVELRRRANKLRATIEEAVMKRATVRIHQALPELFREGGVA